jgi:hypothetical protein
VAEGDEPEATASHPYWTREYIGAGPFKLARWEPGAFVETLAFDGHALGRPRIDRLTVRIIPDDNTMLTNVLAGNVDVEAHSERHRRAVEVALAVELMGEVGVFDPALQTENEARVRRGRNAGDGLARDVLVDADSSMGILPRQKGCAFVNLEGLRFPGSVGKEDGRQQHRHQGSLRDFAPVHVASF